MLKKIIFFSVFALFLIFAFRTGVNAATGQKIWENPTHLNTYIQQGHANSLMMKHAFQEWTRLTKSHVVFYFVSDKNRADIEVYFVDILNGMPAGTAGVTDVKFNSRGKMIHAVIRIPSKVSGSSKNMSKDGVYTSMLHEIGHAIGITTHSTNPQNIMYPVVDVKREITKYDLGELYRMYGWSWDR